MAHDGTFVLPKQLPELTVHIGILSLASSADSEHTTWLVMHSSFTQLIVLEKEIAQSLDKMVCVHS